MSHLRDDLRDDLRTDLRTDPSAELRRAALEMFAARGFEGVSLQQVADRVGYTKANVLYHFGSKQGLFEQALAPAIEAFESFIHHAREVDLEREPARLVEPFVDFLLEHRLAVHIFIHYASSLPGQPLGERAHELIQTLTELFAGAVTDPARYLRINIALGGAAYCLASDSYFDERGNARDPNLRAYLHHVLGSMLAAD